MASPLSLAPRGGLVKTGGLTSEFGDDDSPWSDGDRRSIPSIFWTCLVTIFTCTWISVHPNIAGYKASWWSRFWNRVELMLWGIIAPELLVLYAYRQWLGARMITKELKEKAQGDGLAVDHWTNVHGHFLQMGGFIFQDELGTHYLNIWSEIIDAFFKESWTKECCRRRRKALLSLPLTAEEISDRSKGDIIAKTFVVIQTSWFIIHFIVRAALKLDITELEIITLGYAVLNGVMYFLWWDKPLDVECPIIVHVSCPGPSTGPTRSDSLNKAPSVEVAVVELESRTEYDTHTTSIPSASPSKISILWLNFVTLVLNASIVRGFFCRVLDIAESRKSRRIESTATSVPTFYAYSTTPRMENVVQVVAALLASVFGAIHCIAWFFQFQNTVDCQLWRVSSLYITIAPFLVLLPRLCNLANANLTSSFAGTVMEGFSYITLNLAYYLLLPLYVPARIILLVLAMKQLTYLTPDARRTVEWLNLVPHV
ncbi:hypothetical protein FA15DRAFT_704241 [Coprinopsis marcescibilis]|uniref:Uncharacterized protein n=1 Tax=Coprinopsis marcescibilis TaxID=230819 RepID=A0A5C3KX23_COPMA|nr:hypothetical protein FA15DRAFT_704241 [Coprinopsis marcescibilis]